MFCQTTMSLIVIVTLNTILSCFLFAASEFNSWWWGLHENPELCMDWVEEGEFHSCSDHAE